MSKSNKNLGAINADAALQELAESFPSTRPTALAKTPSKASSPEVEHPLTVRIPMYVAKELRRAHAETGKSHRLIILEALKRWGLPVHDDDLAERRRRA